MKKIYVLVYFLFFYVINLQALTLNAENFDSNHLRLNLNDSILSKKRIKLNDKKKKLFDSSYVFKPNLLRENYNPEFSWKNIKSNYPVSDSIVEDRELANASFKVIEESESWVDSFTNEDIQELPIGVKHTRENVQYAIGITQATFNKDYTELTVFARVRLPQTDSNGYPIELFFGANNVKLSHQGGIVGDANLVLLGDLRIPFNAGKWMLTLKGGFDYKTGEVDNKTFVTINCDGVKELGVQGEVEFSRDLILPVEKNGLVDENKTKVNAVIETENGTQTLQVPHRVKGGFNVLATDWNDLLVGIDLQPFVLAKKRNNKDYFGNFQFHINKAVLDFSDLRNDPAVAFPDYYHDNGLLMPNQQSWRGVYVNTIEVKLPTEFKTSKTLKEQGGDQRVSFGAHHLIVDNNGVSGTFYGDNIFPLNEGVTNKKKAWAYSLDHIEISLAANNFIGASMEGRILLPVSKEKKSNQKQNDTIDSRIGLKYKGLISPEEYLLNVSNTSTIDFNLWKAKGQLLPNSSIELAVREGKFRPKATLHGRLAISASQVDNLDNVGKEVETGEKDDEGKAKKELVEFKGIVFQNLVLQTESPVFSVDYMGYKDEVKLAGFPVSIANIGVTANATNANLYFDLAVNLMGENNGFSAKTSLSIIGQFEEENHRQKWKLDKIALTAIDINADLGGFKVWGSLDLMKDDPVYGDGFGATLGAEFKSVGKIEVNAIFGKTDFRYWMVDAMIDLPPGTGTGTINLSGFAGGASYRMRRADFGSAINGGAFSYEPDKNSGLGVKAMVLLNVVDDAVLKGGAGFEILFNKNGGINQLALYGQGSIMSVGIPGIKKIGNLVNKLNENILAKTKFLGVSEDNVENSFVGKNLLDKADGDFPQVPQEDMTLSAKLGITFDFQNSVLHGELDVYVNTPGGFVQGRASKGRAGWAVLHLAPDEWYFHMGTPTDRLGLKIGVGPISVQAGGYFMVGTKLPDSPPPPPIVAEILGVDVQELDYMRDENALDSGKGFAFGADIAVDTGDLRFLMFYANFQAGAGFDIMLRDYNEAKCSNTGRQVGLNGWYANGQAYAYLQGELGINIKLFFVKKKIPIIKGGAAVLLQAKAPNPIWMRGYVGGHFNLLGGLVKGKFRFKFTLGEECVLEDASPLGGLKIITDVSPEDDAKDIDVFAIPQAAFSMKIGEPIVIPEDDGDKTYRIDLVKYEVLHNGQDIQGELEWSNYKDRASFVSSDILPPDDQITVKVEVSFKEKINGVFRPIVIDGQPATEIEERTFTTGGAPSYIPLHNITYAYPVIDQKYFLEDEYSKGYIQLKRGQDYLFDDPAWETFILYTEESQGQLNEEVFNYNTNDNIVTYNLPDVSQEASYHMQIASRVKGSRKTNSNTSNSNQNDSSTSGAYDGSVENTEVNVQNNKAETASQDGEIERLTYEFKTSKYKTLKRKVKSINTRDYNWGMIYSDVIHLSNRINDHEPFDLIDLTGSKYTENIPLVSIEATLDDTYFTTDLNPHLYSKYPLGGSYTFQHREVPVLGSPPKYALPILSSYLSNLEYEVNEQALRSTFPFRYNLGIEYKNDWRNMRSQIINDYVDDLIAETNPILNFLDESYLFMRYGFYNTTMKYKLPGNKKGTEVLYKFKNNNNFR